MMEFQVPKIVHEEVDELRGIFVIEPLDRGFGYTFGNSLRRVLLSSLEGAAVTSVKIEGVAHEFTTLPGVREDVTDVILNLKQLVCILHGDSPEEEVRLTKRGEGVVTAADIEPPADLEILNPELEIANLSDLERIEGFGESAAVAADGGAAGAGVSLAGGMENFPIEELELGVRSYNCLKRVGIETIGDLVTKSESELAAIPNFGKKSIEEVKETLAQHGLGLRGSNGVEL